MGEVRPIAWLLSALAGAALVGAMMLGVFAYEGATHRDFDASIETLNTLHG
jgi:hypothetical protein